MRELPSLRDEEHTTSSTFDGSARALIAYGHPPGTVTWVEKRGMGWLTASARTAAAARRRSIAVSVIGLTVGVTIAVVLLAVAGWRADVKAAAATQLVEGRISEVGLNDGLDIRVDWVDAEGVEHTTDVAMYEPDYEPKPEVGYPFPLTVEPGNPDNVVPVSEDAVSPADNYWMPAVLAALGAVVLALCWVGRAVMWSRARSRGVGHATPARAWVFHGEFNAGAFTWLCLLPADARNVDGDPIEDAAQASEHPHALWQRVLWAPELELTPSNLPVVVHAPWRPGRRARITLADGQELSATSRLKSRQPRMLSPWPLAWATDMPIDPEDLDDDCIADVNDDVEADDGDCDCCRDEPQPVPATAEMIAAARQRRADTGVLAAASGFAVPALILSGALCFITGFSVLTVPAIVAGVVGYCCFMWGWNGGTAPM